jgi:dihydroorotate dehydrogenase
MGFNSCGMAAVLPRLQRRSGRPGIVGLNLGKNKDSEDATADYEIGIRSAAMLASYIVVNVSSPNTPGLRDLQRRAPLEQLLRSLIATRDRTSATTPLLVKIAPDLSEEECEDIASVSVETGINGIVVSNTTIDRPPGLVSENAKQIGGLSGKPLFEQSTRVLARMYALTHGNLPLIGVGGVESAADAYEKICAGASLIQLYTALAFKGPMLVSEIKRGLTELLLSEGLSSISEAVGTRNAAWISGQTARRGPALGLSQGYENAGMISRAKRRRLSREPWPLNST